MAEHVDTYSQLIEQINYHLQSEEKWSNERINRTFFGTLSIDKWGSYEDGLGESIKTMIPSELCNDKSPRCSKETKRSKRILDHNNDNRQQRSQFHTAS